MLNSKIFGITVSTILLILLAYWAGSKRLVV